MRVVIRIDVVANLSKFGSDPECKAILKSCHCDGCVRCDCGNYQFKTKLKLQTATTFCQPNSHQPSSHDGKRSRSDRGDAVRSAWGPAFFGTVGFPFPIKLTEKSRVQIRKPAKRTLDRPAYKSQLKNDGFRCENY